MYERFYGLQKNPFALTPDPRFMVLTEGHCNAKAGLMYAILGGKGFTVLTGDAGTGKTTLLRSVINSISAEKMCFSWLLNPDLSPDEFSEMAVTDFGLTGGMTKPERLRKLQAYLLDVYYSGKLAVLFVDEAHRLSTGTLEEIRLLTNFEIDNKKLLQIVLAGQEELDESLDRQELRQLKQRVEVRLHVDPLSPEEVRLYIAHRWKCAAESPHPFSTESIRRIAELSGGIPRLINSICDNALLLGFAENAATITEEHALEAGRDLRLTKRESGKPVKKVDGKTGGNGNGVGHHLPETWDPLTVQNGRDRTPVNLELSIPAPVSHVYTENPLSLLGNHRPKQPWWPRFRFRIRSPQISARAEKSMREPQ